MQLLTIKAWCFKSEFSGLPNKLLGLTLVMLMVVSCKRDKLGSDIGLDNGDSAVETTKSRELGTISTTNHPKKIARIEKPEAVQALGEFAVDWEKVAGESQGQDALDKQRELALAVLPKVGGSQEFLKLLDFLTERGAGDLRSELIEKHLTTLFTGPGAAESRDWLLSVEDEKLREQLSQAAGETFSGMGFKDYFEQMGQYGGLHSQAALLKGYCMTMAKSNPEAAIKVYADLGYPKRIDNTGLAAVYASMPPTTNFLKMATEIKEDSMTLAKRCRSALLENWTGESPKDAAQYVISNGNSGVAPDQMAVVVETWSKKSPSDAAAWITALSPSPAKDEGSIALTRHWLETDPAKAWQFVGKVGDMEKKVAAATEVFNEWSKTDRNAATAAWGTVFPQQ